ncbi:MAG: type IV pilus twitching motility protein PilT [Desulfotomaculales bacterium]
MVDPWTLIELAFQIGASDLHITAGFPPAFRLHGEVLPANVLAERGILKNRDLALLRPEDTDRLAREIMGEELYSQLIEKGEHDFSFSLPEVGRCRVNAFKQRGTVALAIRPIPDRVPSLEQLGLPESVKNLARRPHGLVLVTGPTGSGKSTTLAAMIDLLNDERHCHVITLEDPIEYIHRNRKCVINQREIGRDTLSFASALRAALREDPDVILVGEMRDLETIATAITAAETGHLVLATLHTGSAAQTIDRIVDIFPPHQQQQIRLQLAGSLQGVIVQQLLPRRDRQGRVLALEIMIATPAISNLIREGKTYQIISQIQTGARYGMQTMDMALRNLYRAGLIEREEALGRAADPESLSRMLDNI